ncbi:hypothetical protein GDO81_017989 [Engystomops pustulosus]|uniref:Protein-tyrosine-phosphatase n=1 Tax=Engystomops pustulosus TaxID=76066 RepID=A0AAV7A9V9_ENGPU|nr:hypothetical protein GDO81_017989 [Engystomops pustulosus]
MSGGFGCPLCGCFIMCCACNRCSPPHGAVQGSLVPGCRYDPVFSAPKVSLVHKAPPLSPVVAGKARCSTREERGLAWLRLAWLRGVKGCSSDVHQHKIPSAYVIWKQRMGGACMKGMIIFLHVNYFNKMISVLSGLYVGSVCDAMDIQSLQVAGITHILTIDNSELKDLHHSFQKKFIQLLDDSSADLLSCLPECLQFLKDALEKQGSCVLVHW